MYYLCNSFKKNPYGFKKLGSSDNQDQEPLIMLDKRFKRTGKSTQDKQIQGQSERKI